MRKLILAFLIMLSLPAFGLNNPMPVSYDYYQTRELYADCEDPASSTRSNCIAFIQGYIIGVHSTQQISDDWIKEKQLNHSVIPVISTFYGEDQRIANQLADYFVGWVRDKKANMSYLERADFDYKRAAETFSAFLKQQKAWEACYAEHTNSCELV